MKIAVTGHRPEKLGNDYELVSPLVMRIKHELFQVVKQFLPSQMISGMAQGIDTLWAELALELGIPLLAAVPCLGQDLKWPKAARDRYNAILEHPLCTTHMVHKGWYNFICMQKRNEWMVDNCDLLVAVWDESPSGTANCHAYAKKTGREIIHINPKLIVIHEEKHVKL